MRRLNGDLVTLATVAQSYGVGDSAQNLYSLAAYGCNLAPIMEPGDVEIGLSLIGIESFRLVAPGQQIPKMVGFALSEGHMVLAQVNGLGTWNRKLWVLLTSSDDQEWGGIVCGWDFISHGVSSQLRWKLTGHYVICATPLPGWEVDPST